MLPGLASKSMQLGLDNTARGGGASIIAELWRLRQEDCANWRKTFL